MGQDGREHVQVWAPTFYEDLDVGDSFDLGSVTVTDAHIIHSCGLVGDLSPIHHDDVFAQSLGFPRRIAPGILTAGFLIGALSLVSRSGVATHLEDRITYRDPVYAGDTLLLSAIVGRREERSRFGLVWYQTAAHKSTGELACEVEILLGHRYRQA